VIAICLLIDIVQIHATTYSTRILVWGRAPTAIGGLVAGSNVLLVAVDVPDTIMVHALHAQSTHTGHPHTNVPVLLDGVDGTVQHMPLTACQGI
jgi:hypothetical protein